MKLLLSALALAAVFAAPSLQAEVVRPAPDFTFSVAGAGTQSLRSLRGQPVILVVGKSPRDRRFRRQVARLEEVYRTFAAREVVFVAAFTSSEGDLIRSDIPFVVASDGPTVAANYGSDGGFVLATIGPDGNLDLVSSRLHSAAMLRSVLENSYQTATTNRRWPSEADLSGN